MSPQRRPRACVAVAVPPAVEQLLLERCDIDLVRPGAQLQSALGAAEGLLCSNLLAIDDALLASGPNLRVVSNVGVGFNNVDLEAAARRGVIICNTPGVLTDAVADLTIGLIIAFSRRLLDNAVFVRGGLWGSSTPPPLGFDLKGKTLGIVGLGRIGLAVAQRARVFGMEVRFHDVFQEPPPDAAHCTYCSLEALLSESDIVSIHTNLTPESQHLISRRELSFMKPTALLVNTARGPVVDQVALLDALREGKIAGAALDVLEQEPPDPRDPLLALPNLIALPHIGSATVETRAAMLDLAVQNLIAALHDEVPPACVNPEVIEAVFTRQRTGV
ncbi:MAG TPA: D-glycerate dehydrogenase [Tepidiformaceae bacterium]|nr:D-glycerate dehydrogenase [Tepidiformaceae bacterium]